MTWFKDLETLTYFGTIPAENLRAVGWLDVSHYFETGPTDRRVYERLVALLKDPFQPFASAGPHECNVCQFQPESLGTTNLFVPAEGVLLVCPELILHYVNAHRYRPPIEFCDAVLNCPDTRSVEYKRLFLSNGGRALLRHG